MDQGMNGHNPRLVDRIWMSCPAREDPYAVNEPKIQLFERGAIVKTIVSIFNDET